MLNANCGVVMYDGSCSECKRLRDEYEHATTTQIQLERNLLSAVSEHDRDSIHSLNPKVAEAWQLRAALLAAIRDHGSLHVNQPGGETGTASASAIS
jgi:hypothetical protein